MGHSFGCLCNAIQAFLDIHRREVHLDGLDLAQNMFDLGIDPVEIAAFHGHSVKSIQRTSLGYLITIFQLDVRSGDCPGRKENLGQNDLA